MFKKVRAVTVPFDGEDLNKFAADVEDAINNSNDLPVAMFSTAKGLVVLYPKQPVLANVGMESGRDAEGGRRVVRRPGIPSSVKVLGLKAGEAEAVSTDDDSIDDEGLGASESLELSAIIMDIASRDSKISEEDKKQILAYFEKQSHLYLELMENTLLGTIRDHNAGCSRSAGDSCVVSLNLDALLEIIRAAKARSLS